MNNNERPPVDASQAKLPAKEFLTPDELDELWNMRGMKYRVDEFHKSLVERGLIPSVDMIIFRQTFKSVLQEFLVDGRAKREPGRDPIPRFPKVF